MRMNSKLGAAIERNFSGPRNDNIGRRAFESGLSQEYVEGVRFAARAAQQGLKVGREFHATKLEKILGRPFKPEEMS